MARRRRRVPPMKKPGKAQVQTGRRGVAPAWLGRVAQDAVDAAGLEEKLRAVLQIVVQRHLGDDRVDANLQRQDVDLAQHRLDRVELAIGAIYQDGVVLIVRDDAQRVGVRVGPARFKSAQQRIAPPAVVARPLAGCCPGTGAGPADAGPAGLVWPPPLADRRTGWPGCPPKPPDRLDRPSPPAIPPPQAPPPKPPPCLPAGLLPMPCWRLAAAGRLRRYVARREGLLQHIRDILGVAVLQIVDVPAPQRLPPRPVDQRVDPPRLFDVVRCWADTTRTALMRASGMTRTRPASVPPFWLWNASCSADGEVLDVACRHRQQRIGLPGEDVDVERLDQPNQAIARLRVPGNRAMHCGRVRRRSCHPSPT